MCQTTAQDGTDHRDKRSIRPDRVLGREAAPGPTRTQPHRRGDATAVVGTVGTVVKDSGGRTVMGVPVTGSVARFDVLPVMAAIGALAALAAEYSTEVERQAAADHGFAALLNRAPQSSGQI